MTAPPKREFACDELVYYKPYSNCQTYGTISKIDDARGQDGYCYYVIWYVISGLPACRRIAGYYHSSQLASVFSKEYPNE
jgi:hypothetical protein